MRELVDFLKAVMSSGTAESYTRCAGFTTLYFYLLWATYKVFSGTPIKDVDIPMVLAAFLFALYGCGEGMKAIAAIKGPPTENKTEGTQP